MKKSDYNTTALSFGALIDSMLYFDHVVSLSPSTELLFAAIFNDIELHELKKVDQLIKDLLPSDLRNSNFLSRIKDLHRQGVFSPKDLTTARNNMRPIVQLCNDFKLSQLPICLSTRLARSQQDDTENDIVVTVSSLQLIDTERIDINKLLSFRADTEAKARLRRLLFFAYENYAGKSRQFIEDDIGRRLDDYRDAVKKWGFETKKAVLSTIMNSKLVAGGVAGSFLTAYFHEPMIAIASGVGAVGAAIGEIAVQVGQRRFDIREMIANNPVSYIEYVKQTLDRLI